MPDNSWLACSGHIIQGNLQVHVGLLPFYLLAAGSSVSEIFSYFNLFLRRRKTRWVSEFIIFLSFFRSLFLSFYFIILLKFLLL